MITYQNEFIFNEYNYFTNLLKSEGYNSDQIQEVVKFLDIHNTEYKFVLMKDDKGNWYNRSYRNNEKIRWDDVPNWIRPHVWEFQKENKIYQ